MKKSICILIALIFILSTYSTLGYQKNQNEINIESIVRINIDEKISKFFKNYEIVSGKPGLYLDYIIPKIDLYILDENNIEYLVIQENVNDNSHLNLRNYHTLEEIEQILQNIAQNYPDITSLYSIGKTFEDRDIWCLEISDNPGVDEGEPGVFFMGLHHAREWPTVEICLYIIENLTSNYNINPEIRDMINNRRIWIVSCVNPDGYYFCYDLNNDWRKNRHYFPEYNAYGVDLNRNYQGSSNGDPNGMWGSLGMFHNPGLSLYCGPNPLSEIETQSVKNIFIENDITTSISYHTHGELVMWPWGYSPNVQTPDNDYMAEVGEEMASLIAQQDGTGTYTPTQSAGLYPTSGDTSDWVYGYHHYVLGKPHFTYTIEACQSYHPSDDLLDQLTKENFEAAFYLIQETENIKNIIPRVLPPILNQINVDNNDYIVSWEQQNPDASADYYEIQELSNLYLHTDTAASAEILWELNGFILTDQSSNSVNFSYRSHTVNNEVSSMTTKYPLYVEEDMNLNFWCKYDIEENYDKAMVEVSRDGRSFDVLDTFTGRYNNWEQKQYSLEDYTYDSIYIRFRYSTDEGTSYDGFFIDDISPIPEYHNIDVIQNQYTENSYNFINKTNGIFYYQIKGFNYLGWGDFSTLKKIVIDTDQNQAPNAPIITGTHNGKYGETYTYTFTSSDPDLDEIFYYISWGDETGEEWFGPYSSGTKIAINHTWDDQGEYLIKARAKDTYDNMGDWSTLHVSMPYKHYNSILMNWIYKFISFFQSLSIK